MATFAESIAIALRAVRQIRGYSLTDVSQGSGVPVRRLAAFEEERRTPTASEFSKVWSFLSSDPPPPGAPEATP
jgi:hypothetical protein